MTRQRYAGLRRLRDPPPHRPSSRTIGKRREAGCAPHRWDSRHSPPSSSCATVSSSTCVTVSTNNRCHVYLCQEDVNSIFLSRFHPIDSPWSPPQRAPCIPPSVDRWIHRRPARAAAVPPRRRHLAVRTASAVAPSASVPPRTPLLRRAPDLRTVLPTAWPAASSSGRPPPPPLTTPTAATPSCASAQMGCGGSSQEKRLSGQCRRCESGVGRRGGRAAGAAWPDLGSWSGPAPPATALRAPPAVAARHGARRHPRNVGHPHSRRLRPGAPRSPRVSPPLSPPPPPSSPPLPTPPA